MANSSQTSFGATSDDKPLPLSASAIVAPVVSGSHILRINGYSYTKALGNAELTASEMFDVGGHPWSLQYYPEGWIGFALKLHHQNASLKNSDFKVKAKFTICLLDQDGNPVRSYIQNSVICTFSNFQSSFRCNLMTSGDLEKSVYLKEDVFSVRCDVTVLKKALTKAIPVSEVLRGVVKKES